jgi:hypothetical protein
MMRESRENRKTVESYSHSAVTGYGRSWRPNALRDFGLGCLVDNGEKLWTSRR